MRRISANVGSFRARTLARERGPYRFDIDGEGAIPYLLKCNVCSREHDERSIGGQSMIQLSERAVSKVKELLTTDNKTVGTVIPMARK